MIDLDRRQFLATTGGLAAMALFPDSLPAAVRLDEPMKVGIVGMGRQARAIVSELAKIPGVKIAAICDVDAQRLASAKTRAPEAQTFDSHGAMLDKAKDLNAVIIATPTHLHAAPALAAISAGKHVYCEGPIAHTLDDARAMAKAVGATGNKLAFAVGHEGRTNPVYGLARSFAKTDAFKDFVGGRTHSAQKTSWRATAADAAREAALNWRLDKAVSLGVLGEIVSHQLDVVHWFRGKYPVSARASGGIRLHNDGREIADTVQAEFIYDDGGRVSSFATLANSYEGRYELLQGSSSAIRLSWTHGWMFKESDAPTQGWEVYANKQQFHTDSGITLIADATKLAAQNKLKEGVGLPETPLYYALENFIAAAAAGRAIGAGGGDTKHGATGCSADEAVKTLAVVLAADEALRTGNEIKVAKV